MDTSDIIDQISKDLERELEDESIRQSVTESSFQTDMLAFQTSTSSQQDLIAPPSNVVQVKETADQASNPAEGVTQTAREIFREIARKCATSAFKYEGATPIDPPPERVSK